ncbi:MAG: tetratricopeptide repeat protein [Pyrinomonadaceae bacterium]
MLKVSPPVRLLLSTFLALLVAAAPIILIAQDLVPIGSITGGSSVFVFRNAAKAARRFVASVKPSRTKAQRIETVRKISRQYATVARAATPSGRAKAIDPTKLPKNVLTLPAAEGSRIFAGVGEYYIGQGDFDRAIEVFTDAASLDPANLSAKTGLSEAYALRGNDLLVKDQAGAAKSVFLEALKLDPRNAAAYFGLGEVYADLEQFSEAIASYQKSLEANKNLTEIYVPLGILYYQSGDIAKAGDLLTKALAFSAETFETQYFLGLIRETQDRPDEALTAFRKAVSFDQTSAEARFHAGEALLKLKRAAEAVPEFQKAVELKPAYFDAWFGLGEAHYVTGDFPEAIVAYKAAAKLKNDNWEVFNGLGESYRQTNKFEEAESNYRLAALFITRVKDYNKATEADIYSKTGLVIGQQCDINVQKNLRCGWPSAIKALQKAYDISGNPVDSVNLGWAYFRAGHTDAEMKNMAAARPNLELAQAALQRAVESGPPASEYALQNLASVQIDLGDFKSAIDTLTKLIEKRPNETFTKYALGVAYNKSGDLASAEKWLRTVSDIEPNNVGYLIGLAETLMQRKNGKELKKIIDRLKPLDPSMAQNLDRRRQLLRL